MSEEIMSILSTIPGKLQIAFKEGYHISHLEGVGCSSQAGGERIPALCLPRQRW